MESARNLELIDQAIKKLLEEKRSNKEDNDHHHVLNKLLSELEVLKGSSTLKESEDEVNSPSVGEVGLQSEKDGEGDGSTGEIGAEEIVKELRQVKRQNVVTHCLLSALIVVTLAWQLSEVSLILKLKNGISHPFKSFGSLLAGMIKLPGTNAKDANKEEHTETSAPHMPELPHMPDLGLNGEKQ